MSTDFAALITEAMKREGGDVVPDAPLPAEAGAGQPAEEEPPPIAGADARYAAWQRHNPFLIDARPYGLGFGLVARSIWPTTAI
jgi:hypothetical protein